MHQKYYLAFDLETAGVNYSGLDEAQQEYLVRGATSEAEKNKKIDEMGLSPITARIVTIGLQLYEEVKTEDKLEYVLVKNAALAYNPEFDGTEKTEKEVIDGITYYYASEKGIVETFWKTLEIYKYCTLISFNGRNFDAPFLMLRSALLQVHPTRNLMDGTKFNYGQHIDLIDELTFYTQSFYGATRKFNFDYYSRAFGLESPKSQGVDGSKVKTLFEQGEYLTIAQYCMRDVKATFDLFLRIKDYLYIKI